MHRTTLNTSSLVALLISGLLLSAPAWADNGHGKQKHHKKYEQGNDDRRDEDRRDEDRHDDKLNVSADVRFGDHDREVVHDYYQEHERRSSCPPGLAKKHNGCMPPGQAKKWRLGRPLPRDVIYYELPPRIIVELGTPPAGHKYVRVAADILLIAVGTGMVVDAIEDLGRI